MLLKGKKAVVTGGSQGIGKEIVLCFLKEGAEVAFLDMNPSPHMAEMEALAKEAGTSVYFYEANVADEENITSVINTIIKEREAIDILVNNAGITRDGLLFGMKSENWHSVLSVNLTSVFYICKVVARHMAGRKAGSIINMASIVGVSGNGGQTNYSASKAGLIGFSKSLSKEVSSRGVRVNAVAPGFINTKMTEVLKDSQKEALMTDIPLKRMGEAEEVANAVLFFASDLSSYTTGHVLMVDGGMGM